VNKVKWFILDKTSELHIAEHLYFYGDGGLIISLVSWVVVILMVQMMLLMQVQKP
jgi:hypothetical protein